MVGSAPIKSQKCIQRLISAAHAFVEKRPALPALKFLLVRLLLTTGPFRLIFGPLLLRRVPLLRSPALDLGHCRWVGRCRRGSSWRRRRRWRLRERNSADNRPRKNDAAGNKGTNTIHRCDLLDIDD